MTNFTSLRDLNSSYTLDDNPLEGFNKAVYNGQNRLALEYAVLLFDHVFYGDRSEASEESEVDEYQAQIDALKAELKEIKASLAPFRKITKGNNPAPQPDSKAPAPKTPPPEE